MSNTLEMEAVDISFLPATACSWVVAGIPKMVASGTLPVRSCKGYISAPWVLGGQACKATAEASRRLSDPVPLLLSLHALLPAYFPWWGCCMTQELVVQCTSASLILVVQCNFASLIAVVWHTSASLISAAWHTLASLISAAWLT